MSKNSRVVSNLNDKSKTGKKSNLNNKEKTKQTKKGKVATNQNKDSNAKNEDDEYAYDSSDEEDIRYNLFLTTNSITFCFSNKFVPFFQEILLGTFL